MKFKLIVLLIFALLDVYLVWSLGLHAVGIFALATALLSILWLPFVFWEQDREEISWAELVLQWTAFCAMGFISFLWIATMGRDLLSLLVHVPLHTPKARDWIFIAATLGFLAGNFGAFFRLRVLSTEIPIEGLSENLDGFRIVQLSDIHVGPTIRLRTVKKIVKKVLSARPDLLVLTGDAVDGNVAQLAQFLEPVRELAPKYGKFYVPGNHEYYWGAEQWVEFFSAAGFHVLLNSSESVRVGGAVLGMAGVTDPAARMMGGEPPDLAKAVKTMEAASFPKILLAHQPGIAPEAEKAGFQIQISGHTHGGQFFPWTLAARWVHRFPHGLGRVSKMWVYVSRGTGYWGPPVRLGSPAEVSLLILKRA